MEQKVLAKLERLKEVEEMLGQPDVLSDQKRYRMLAQEHAYLSELCVVWEVISKAKRDLEEAKELSQSEKDPEFRQMLAEDIQANQAAIEEKTAKLENLLVPPDPNDSKTTLLELRAGTGGDEAALFVGDCVRMYKMFAEKMGWRLEQLSCSPSEVGGYKEFVMVLSGPNVYRYLKHEGGIHRVQRVPATESQGRVHTSAITVAVLLEPDEESTVIIDERDLRVDTYRSSGAGGQHVNTTDSAVRLTHIPTGIVAECQDERSQHKNKDKAMRILKAKIAERERRKQIEEQASHRAAQVGTGDRSGRIRTYNFPQNRVTDHRISMTRYHLDLVMTGDLEEFSNALIAQMHQEQLEAS